MKNVLVLGIGGAGSSMAVQMRAPLKADVILANTDVKALTKYHDIRCLTLEIIDGSNRSPCNPSAGSRAAQESLPQLEAAVGKPELLVLVVGLGGVTGTGAATVVSKWAHERSIPVVVATTIPFSIESERRMVAQQAIKDLNSMLIPTLIVDLANLEKSHADKPLIELFNYAAEILTQMVQSYAVEARQNT